MDRSDLFAHSIKFIFMILGIYIIIINIIMWSNAPSTASGLGNGITFGAYHSYSMQHWRGFSWFFNEVSSFNGWQATYATFNNYCNIVGRYQITGNGIVDTFLAVGRVLTAPIVLLWALLMDISSFIRWLFNFLNNFGGF